MADPRRDALISMGRATLGIPYALPPSPPATTDCSYWYGDNCQKAGAPIPGWLTTVRTAEEIRAALVPIAFTDVLPGDALFFENTYDVTEASKVGDGHVASHIGMSLGAGTMRMLSAVEPVSKESDISTGYWQDRILSAGRLPALVASVDTGGTPDPLPRGIDVSSNNGSIDWAAVAASGVAFAWIKVTEDDGYLNPRFETDWLLSRRVGLVRGAYHFARPDATGAGSDAVAEADWMLGQIEAHGGLAPGDLLALDLESGSGDLGQWALDFLHRCEQRTGFKPFVYTAEWFSDPHEIDLQPTIAGYPLWQASYQTSMPAPVAPWSTITIWQHSDAGTVPGISGNVDLNVSTVSLDQLRALGKPGAPVVAPLSAFQYVELGDVGSGLLAMMAEDGTEPIAPSTWLPLGRSSALVEEAIGLNGTRYTYHLTSGRHWRHPAA